MSAVAAPRYPRYKRVTTMVVLAIFAVWVAYVLLAPNGKAQGIPIGSVAPDFELVDLSGKTVKLSDFKGKPVMLNFFATWCPPCRAEMPALQAVYKDYEAKGFVILAVNLGETNLAVTNFAKGLNLTFPIVIDKDDSVTRTYGIIPLPTSYFVDKNGKVVSKVEGEITKAKLESLAKMLTQ